MYGNTFWVPRRGLAQSINRCRARWLIALGAHARPCAHAATARRSRRLLRIGMRQLGFVGHEFVDAHDHAAMLFDLPLLPRRGLGDLALEPAGLESAHDATLRVDLLEQCLGFGLELVGERFE